MFYHSRDILTTLYSRDQQLDSGRPFSSQYLLTTCISTYGAVVLCGSNNDTNDSWDSIL